MAPERVPRRERGESSAARRGGKGLARSAIVLVIDVLDDLGHVVLVLAEFRCVFEHLFVLFLVFLLVLAARGLAAALAFTRLSGLALLLGLLLDLAADRNFRHLRLRFVRLGGQVGLKLFVERRDILVRNRRRDRARLSRLDEELGIERRAAFRTCDRISAHVVIARAAIRTDPLGTPLRLRHGTSATMRTQNHLWRPFATTVGRCQKLILEPAPGRRWRRPGAVAPAIALC